MLPFQGAVDLKNAEVKQPALAATVAPGTLELFVHPLSLLSSLSTLSPSVIALSSLSPFIPFYYPYHPLSQAVYLAVEDYGPRNQGPANPEPVQVFLATYVRLGSAFLSCTCAVRYKLPFCLFDFSSLCVLMLVCATVSTLP